MKNLIIPFVVFASTGALASSFSQTDNLLTEATRIRSITAERKVSWAEEKSRLESLEESYKAILKAKRESLKNLEAEIENILNTVSPISEKIFRDEAALKKLSDYLDASLEFLKNDVRVMKALKNESVLFDDFKSKNVFEKLSLLCGIRTKLKTIDESVREKNGEIFTGAIISAKGKTGNAITILEVKGELGK